MATTVMLLSVLAALVKAILFADNRINDDRFTADTTLAVPQHFGTVHFGTNANTNCADTNYIRIEVDPNTLNVTSYCDIEDCVIPYIFYYVSITWDVRDSLSIGHNIYTVCREIMSWDWFHDNDMINEAMVKTKIHKLAEKMNNRIVNITIG